MIKRIIRQNILSLFLLLVSLAVLAGDYVAYRKNAAVELKPGNGARSTAHKSNGVIIKELDSLLRKPVRQNSRYQIIAEKNLFDNSRHPWTPPQIPKKDKANEKAKVASPVRKGVILYGTFVSKGKRVALLQFKYLRGAKKQKLVKEGEVVTDKKRTNTPRYKIVKVLPGSVVIRDNTGEFTVDLYAGKVHRERTTRNRTSIGVAAGKPRESTVPLKPPPSPANREVIGTRIGSRQRHTNKVLQKRRELVKEGQMKKINTPFGSVYVPVRK